MFLLFISLKNIAKIFGCVGGVLLFADNVPVMANEKGLRRRSPFVGMKGFYSSVISVSSSVSASSFSASDPEVWPCLAAGLRRRRRRRRFLAGSPLFSDSWSSGISSAGVSIIGAGSSAVVAAASVSAVLSSAFPSSGVAGGAGATSGFGSGRGSGLGAGAGFCLGFGFCAGAGFGSSGAVSVFGSTGFACSFFGAVACFLGVCCWVCAGSFLGCGL